MRKLVVKLFKVSGRFATTVLEQSHSLLDFVDPEIYRHYEVAQRRVPGIITGLGERSYSDKWAVDMPMTINIRSEATHRHGDRNNFWVRGSNLEDDNMACVYENSTSQLEILRVVYGVLSYNMAHSRNKFTIEDFNNRVVRENINMPIINVLYDLMLEHPNADNYSDAWYKCRGSANNLRLGAV